MIDPRYLRSDHRPRELERLEINARPHENLVRAVALFSLYLRPEIFGFRRIPNLKEALVAQISQWTMILADADVAVGIDHT